jgi:hypothetical protein
MTLTSIVEVAVILAVIIAAIRFFAKRAYSPAINRRSRGDSLVVSLYSKSLPTLLRFVRSRPGFGMKTHSMISVRRVWQKAALIEKKQTAFTFAWAVMEES